TRLPATALPSQLFLGALGMPGMTAWAGLHKVARLQAGETLLVSAASGAVGTMAVQLAKRAGARVIGSTGSADKVAYLKTLGADAVINYRETPDLDAELARLAPEGIQVYFENVGGAMLDAALNNMALHGRIVLCGLIEQYNSHGQGNGPRNLAQMIRKRILMQGLLVSDHWQHYGEFLAEAIPAFEAGLLQAEETISEGLASMPQAFIGLFEGRNTGKMLVRLG
ncbi:MAG: NADP-dependent oxidoreductase, partial [Aeromonas sp.]|nr:NADP-dependent oxidoreductase [Aeromonas sp.]